MLNLIEALRKQAIESLFKNPSFSKTWDSSWKHKIKANIGIPIHEDGILNLGDSLSDIFKSTGAGLRRGSSGAQSGASSAGTTWESLVCWYLNLCLIGTRVVAFKKRSLIASPFLSALSINYGTTITNSESDLIVLIFPGDSDFTGKLLPNTQYNFEGSVKNLFNKAGVIYQKRLTEYFDFLVKSPHFRKFELSVVQCKTNWNDNAQIPMLWDLIYNVRSFSTTMPVSIGLHGYHLKNLDKFTYSFVTVPTNNKPYTSEKMPVKRVANLSGGNYWGQATLGGVAFSIQEIFHKNFSNGIDDLRKGIREGIVNLHTKYSYFDTI